MLTQKDKDLQEILSYVNLTQLPPALNQAKSKKIWVDAILEVRKVDCSLSYVYAYNRYGREPLVVHTVGSAAAIRETVAVYPVNYLTKEFLPDMRSRNAIVSYLASIYNLPIATLSEMPDDKLKVLLYTSGIDRQIDDMKTKKKLRQDRPCSEEAEDIDEHEETEEAEKESEKKR